MSAYVKFNTFVGALASKTHDLLGTGGSTADVLKVLLSNTQPNASTATVIANVTEITPEHGYSAGGNDATNIGTSTSGTLTVTGVKVTITASGGTIGPFRYAVLYNSTAAGGPLVSYWSRPTSLTLNDGDDLNIRFQASDTTGNIFTLA